MKLPKQVIPLKILGYNGKVDSKIAPVGMLTTAENVQATRRTDGGVELKKRFGFTEVTGGKSIEGGGSISAAVTGAAYNNELVLLDGNKLYSRSDATGKWNARGKAQTIAADLKIVSGNESNQIVSGADSAPINADVAYSGGLSCHVSSGDELTLDTPVRVYVRDATTESIVSSFSFSSEYRARVVACSSAFFIFCWKEPTSGTGTKVTVRKISTATPGTMSASQDAVTDIEPVGDDGIFDVRADTSGDKIWIAYALSGGGIGIKSWVASTNVAGVTSTYMGRSMQMSCGFLDWDFSNSRGYFVGAHDTGLLIEVFLIEFNTATGAETADTLLDDYGSNPGTAVAGITGYRTSGGVVNAYWSYYETPTGPDRQIDQVYGYTSAGGGVVSVVMKSVVLASRMAKYNGRWYCQVARDFGSQGQRTLLLEIIENPTGANGEIALAGALFTQDSFGAPITFSHLASLVSISGSRFLTAAPSVMNRAPVASTARTEHYAHVAVTLDFAGTGLGAPVQFNDVLHLPGAAGREYDGKDVVESGFYVDPEAPFELDYTAGSPGEAQTPNQTYQYCVTWARVDSRGRLHRSAPGPIASFTTPLVGVEPNPNITLFLYNLRATDTSPKFSGYDETSPARIELWRTQGDLEIFYLHSWYQNDAESDYTGQITDDKSDDDIAQNEILYTQSEELDNQKAPAVKVLRTWQNRLFALTGDGTVWFTKEGAEGFGTEWSDEFRILVGDEGGRPTALGSIDTSFVIFKRKRAYFTQGAGPDDKGAGGPFPQPQPLEQDLGVVNATGAVDMPNGIMCETPEGRFVLTRALSFEPAEGTEDQNVTILGGAGVDSRSMTVFVTAGSLLVRDWQLNQWYVWSKSGNGLAGVAICRWNNQICVFQSDGTVLREIASQYFDGSSTDINELLEFTYTRLENFRLYQFRIVGEIMGTTTITETVTYNGNSSTAASKTKSVTTSDADELNVIPNTGRAASVKVKLQETSTTGGFKLSQVGLEVGTKVGLKKVGSSRNFS